MKRSVLILARLIIMGVKNLKTTKVTPGAGAVLCKDNGQIILGSVNLFHVPINVKIEIESSFYSLKYPGLSLLGEAFCRIIQKAAFACQKMSRK